MSRSWIKRVRLGRLQLGVRLFQHRYPTSSDRWVLQPEVIWDRNPVGKRRSVEL